jgi:hypothetical protein
MGFVCAEQVHVETESSFFLKKLCERGGGGDAKTYKYSVHR